MEDRQPDGSRRGSWRSRPLDGFGETSAAPAQAAPRDASMTTMIHPHCRTVNESSGWFRGGAAEGLYGGSTNQLFRGLMLSALTEQHLDAVGRYVAIGTTADDATARRSVDVVAAELQDPRRLRLIALEELIATARRLNTRRLSTWANAFDCRYLP